MRGSLPWKTNRARVLRSNETSAEHKLWMALRNRQLGGLRFARQVPIGPYFADFCCRELKLIVEIDGATHDSPAEVSGDAEREAFLIGEGFQVFRVSNSDVFRNLEGVLEGVLAIVATLRLKV